MASVGRGAGAADGLHMEGRGCSTGTAPQTHAGPGDVPRNSMWSSEEDQLAVIADRDAPE